MKKRSPAAKENGGNMWFKALLVALAAAALSVALVALFAFVMQKQWFGIESIGTVNVVIKLVSSAAAALLASRGGSRVWLWGAVSACMYMLLTYMVFSLISGSFALDAGIFTDLAMCALCGAAAGMIKNLIKH